MILRALAAAIAALAVNAYSTQDVERLIDRTPQIERPDSRSPFGNNYVHVRIKGTGYDGWIIPGDVYVGELAGGRNVLTAPIESFGTGAIFAALLWEEEPAGSWRYAGSIASPDGHLNLWFEGGAMLALTPVYKDSDAECCPSAHRLTRYTIENARIVELGVRTIARDEHLPPWMYVQPGAHVFLESGTPAVVDEIASDGDPCDRTTRIRVRTIDGSWKGLVSVESLLPAVPAGTLLDLHTPPSASPRDTLGAQRDVLKDSGIAIDGTVRVVHFDQNANDPSARTRDTFVTVTSGPHAGAQGWVFLRSTLLHGYWIPAAMVCRNDERGLTLYW